MEMAVSLDQQQPDLFTKFQVAANQEHLSSRTEITYQHWITRFLLYFDSKNPMSLSDRNVDDFLNYLNAQFMFSRAKMNQVKSALSFLFEKVLNKPIKRFESLSAPEEEKMEA